MKAKVREGVRYGAAGKYSPGRILDVTEDELRAFPDKLELLPQEDIHATTAAEEAAKQYGLALDGLKGSGKDGRILLRDVEAWAQALGVKHDG